jgi:lipoprotein-anchoring transpeptidase ErfK/SrfK
MVPKQWHHQTTMMPATAASKTRVRVRLARRPDESQAWVRFRAVRISVTTFSLVLDLSERRLYKFKAGRQVGSYPVGIGRPATPTPTGSYFIAFHASPNGPGYGQAMLETSAHSKVIKTFEGGNDAIIAIHGPITAASDAAIGTDGTRISNGCIRMHDRQLRKLIWVPDGTPLAIVP